MLISILLALSALGLILSFLNLAAAGRHAINQHAIVERLEKLSSLILNGFDVLAAKEAKLSLQTPKQGGHAE